MANEPFDLFIERKAIKLKVNVEFPRNLTATKKTWHSLKPTNDSLISHSIRGSIAIDSNNKSDKGMDMNNKLLNCLKTRQ